MANLFAVIATYPIYSMAIGSTPFQAGLQNTVFAAAAVVFRLLLGPVMDRKGVKPLMMIGAFAFATTPLIILIAPSYNLLLGARVYQAIGLAVFLPGISTMVAELAPAKRIGAYLGTLRIFFNLALLSGPAAALYLVDTRGFGSWFIVSAIIGILSLFLISTVKSPARPSKAEYITSTWSQIRTALTVKTIYPVLGGIALLSVIYSAVISFSAPYITESYTGSAAAIFFIIYGAAGMVGAVGSGFLTDRVGPPAVAWPLLATLGSGAIIFYFLPSSSGLVIASAMILGLSSQGSSLAFAAWLLALAKPGLRATTISVQENTIDIFFAVGALTFGLAAQGPGIDIAFLAVGLITIAAVLPLKLIAGKISSSR